MNNTKQLEKKINKEYKTGNVKSAIELCQLGLQKDPTNADLHMRLGDLYLAYEKLKKESPGYDEVCVFSWPYL